MDNHKEVETNLLQSLMFSVDLKEPLTLAPLLCLAVMDLLQQLHTTLRRRIKTLWTLIFLQVSNCITHASLDWFFGKTDASCVSSVLGSFISRRCFFELTLALGIMTMGI